MERQPDMPAQGTAALPPGNGEGPGRRRLIVVGSGIAGLYAALLAADAGIRVTLLTKGGLDESNTWYAQGGISAVLADPAHGDTVAAHSQDTLHAGAGHCNEQAVRMMCTEARRDIAGLQRFGVCFDPGPDGGPALGLEAAHSAPRILHAGGDATGARVAAALISAVRACVAEGRLTLLAGAHVTGLRQSRGTATGVQFRQDGHLHILDGDAVLLATGGAGQLFAQTTNPAAATADGLALAVRAGAAVADLEFFQFHPTCFVDTEGRPGSDPLLISEAVRGEGAVLLDAGGRRYMRAYHPDAELAPRDIVSRSTALHLAKLGDPSGHVYLDARAIELAKGAGFLQRRFPTLSRKTREAGIDWTRELVPVAPAAHYWMGGVATDLHARTSIPGLYAAGEVACTGVQGANRLASNSLLEGLVFGRRAVENFLSGDCSAWVSPDGAPPRTPHDPPTLASSAREPGSCGPTAAGGLPLPYASGAPAVDEGGAPPVGLPTNVAAGSSLGVGLGTPFSRGALQRLMTARAGVLRSGELLAEAAETLGRWAAVVGADPATDADLSLAAQEDRNLLLAAQLLVAAAMRRRGSLGAHYRSDEPDTHPLRPKASLVHD